MLFSFGFELYVEKMSDHVLTVRQVVCQVHQNPNTSSKNRGFFRSQLFCGILHVDIAVFQGSFYSVFSQFIPKQ